MKLYEIVEKNLASMGIIRNLNSDYCYYPVNRQHLKVQSVLILTLISLYTFSFHVADSLANYMDSFYIIIVSSAVFISYTTTICKMDNLFNFFDSCEKLCIESE